jgi:hypothetical protein
MIMTVVIMAMSFSSAILSITERIKNKIGEISENVDLINILAYTTIGFLGGFVLSVVLSYYGKENTLVLQGSVVLYSIMVLAAALIALWLYVSTKTTSHDWIIVLIGTIFSAMFCIGLTFIPSFLGGGDEE